MREQTQYTTMLPNYNIPTDMQAPFFTRSVQPGAWSAAPQRTGHTIPQQLLRSSRLKVENQVTREVVVEEE